MYFSAVADGWVGDVTVSNRKVVLNFYRRDYFGLGASFIGFGISCLVGFVVVREKAAETRGLTPY